MSKFLMVGLAMGGSEALAMLRGRFNYRQILHYAWCPVKPNVAGYLEGAEYVKPLQDLDRGYGGRIPQDITDYLVLKAKFINTSGILEDAKKAAEDLKENCPVSSVKDIDGSPAFGGGTKFGFMEFMLAPTGAAAQNQNLFTEPRTGQSSFLQSSLAVSDHLKLAAYQCVRDMLLDPVDTDAPKDPKRGDTDAPKDPKPGDADAAKDPQPRDTNAPKDPQPGDTYAPQDPKLGNTEDPNLGNAVAPDDQNLGDTNAPKDPNPGDNDPNPHCEALRRKWAKISEAGVADTPP